MGHDRLDGPTQEILAVISFGIEDGNNQIHRVMRDDPAAVLRISHHGLQLPGESAFGFVRVRRHAENDSGNKGRPAR